MKRLLLAGALSAAISPSLADPIDPSTPCSVAIQAFDSEKRAGEVLAGAPSPQVLEVGNYIMNIMEQLDHQNTDRGKLGIWSELSQSDQNSLAPSIGLDPNTHWSRDS